MQQPAHVRVPQSTQRAEDPIAPAHVWTVRIAVDVGVGVVTAMVGDPADHQPSTAIVPSSTAKRYWIRR